MNTYRSLHDAKAAGVVKDHGVTTFATGTEYEELFCEQFQDAIGDPFTAVRWGIPFEIDVAIRHQATGGARLYVEVESDHRTHGRPWDVDHEWPFDFVNVPREKAAYFLSTAMYRPAVYFKLSADGARCVLLRAERIAALDPVELPVKHEGIWLRRQFVRVPSYLGNFDASAWAVVESILRSGGAA